MTYSPENFGELKTHFAAATEHDEAGRRYIRLPALSFPCNGSVETADALLCPGEHSGYSTRLFLDRPFPHKGQNWTTHSILGRQWHTPSFNNISADLPLMAILANHLRALL